MKRSIFPLLLLVLAAVSSGVGPAGARPVASPPSSVAIEAEDVPVAAEAAAVPGVPVATRAPGVSDPSAVVVSAPTVPQAASPSTDSNAARVDYINAMYLAVVPAGQRAKLTGHYQLGYNLAGLGCGTGCSGLSGTQARSSFNDDFFAQSVTYQRNTIAHEAAHAYGMLYIAGYGMTSWAGIAGWQAQFHELDRSFAGQYDAEAWASCIAWKESGFNNRVDQIVSVCTPAAAALAMSQLG